MSPKVKRILIYFIILLALFVVIKAPDKSAERVGDAVRGVGGAVSGLWTFFSSLADDLAG